MMTSSLQNKKILIIGGTSGIGLAIAKCAAGEGAVVEVASRHASHKHDEVVASVGIETSVHSFDITSEKDIRELLGKIGHIDHLVFTIRPDISPASFSKTTIKDAKLAFESKFWGAYQLIQMALNQIDGKGSIIMTTGIAGDKIYNNFSTMAIINSAVETLCRSLAIELAPVRVNCVSPGFVAPKSKQVEEYALQFPARRVASPEEVAESYIFLMKNTYITGSTVVVDGGAILV